ncbi:MAG: SLBB domain-containing protein [Candidatus Marinimicrobia bacterium]|nr:SLBB domain-containing protein [Candidatus Neomarinimicrobiota bacterium]
MKNKFFIIGIIFISMLISQSNLVNRSGQVSNQLSFSSEPYVTGDDGIVRMYVNIIGHVKNPGTYLVYEGINILSLLALAGGPLPGAKLKNVRQFNNDEVTYLNLYNYLETGENMDFILYPHNTIYIEQSLGSYLFSNSSIINSTLQVLNIFLTILRTN